MPTDPPRSSRVPMTATVRRTEWLSRSMVRVVVGGAGLSPYAGRAETDAYVKVLFLHPDGGYPRPIDVEAIRATMPPDRWPRQRTYTVRAWDGDALELTLDFVVHGDSGIAGPWAKAARIGDEVLLLGSGGGYRPDPAADWHLLVGDESALPAIAVALEELPDAAQAHVFVEVDGPEDEIELALPARGRLSWVHRDGEEVGSRLVESVAALHFPTGAVHAFVHGEAGLVKRLRRLLVIDRGVPRDQLSISGYWRYDSDDEGWRALKREWNADVEEAERSAGVV